MLEGLVSSTEEFFYFYDSFSLFNYSIFGTYSGTVYVSFLFSLALGF